MAIELPGEARTEAVASIQRYFQAHLDDEIGNIAAGALLDFFLQEIAPSVYNKAVRDAQERVQMHLMDLDLEVREDEFRYWRR